MWYYNLCYFLFWSCIWDIYILAFHPLLAEYFIATNRSCYGLRRFCSVVYFGKKHGQLTKLSTWAREVAHLDEALTHITNHPLHPTVNNVFACSGVLCYHLVHLYLACISLESVYSDFLKAIYLYECVYVSLWVYEHICWWVPSKATTWYWVCCIWSCSHLWAACHVHYNL